MRIRGSNASIFWWWTTRVTDSGRAPTADGQNTAATPGMPGVNSYQLLTAHRHAVQKAAKLTHQRVVLREPPPFSCIRECLQRQVGGDCPNRTRNDDLHLVLDGGTSLVEQVLHQSAQAAADEVAGDGFDDESRSH